MNIQLKKRCLELIMITVLANHNSRSACVAPAAGILAICCVL
jgi:hypothetical protein